MYFAPPLSAPDQVRFRHKLQVFTVQGRDTCGRRVLNIIGNRFPAPCVGDQALIEYLEAEIFPSLGNKPFVIVYFPSDVRRGENFPGISRLRSVCEAVPMRIKHCLEAVYFVHPGVLARLFFAVLGRFLFGAGLYRKLKYVTRLEFVGIREEEGDGNTGLRPSTRWADGVPSDDRI